MRRCFADSSVLIYSDSYDAKHGKAEAALRQTHVISAQVLNEFANVSRRKMGKTLAQIRAAETLFLALLEVIPLDVPLHQKALDISEYYGFGFYDSLIVAAALHAGCDTLFTEDLQHGQLIEGTLRVENPFV